MRIFLSDIRSELDSAIRELQRPMAEAATAALREVAKDAVRSGKTHLASRGFSASSQKGFTSSFSPKRGPATLKSQVRIFHRVGYFGLFEEGGNISGKPLLWLPLNAVPKKGITGRQLRPREFVSRFGPLRSVNHPGRRPLLVGKSPGSDKAVPLFVGVSAVRLRDRLDLYGVIDRALDRFPPPWPPVQA